ncbi:hypothetical protein LguiB_019697 [Lonicera macranthoides]
MDLLEHGREATERVIHFFFGVISHINFSLKFFLDFHSLDLVLVELFHDIYFS